MEGYRFCLQTIFTFTIKKISDHPLINETTIYRYKHSGDLPGIYAFDWHVFQEESQEK